MIHEINSLRPDTLPAFAQDFLTEEMLLFDIETTGLSPAKNQIYCIGCGSLKGAEVCVELFFAEGPEDEADVLSAFFRLADTHPILLTFNGTTFDLPFVKQRAALQADPAFHPAAPDPGRPVFPESWEHIDLYREVRGLNRLLELPSCRQKAVEQFLGCEREDLYSGGQLIEFYQKYESDPDPELLKPLLLHNREDVIGMFDLLGILAYRQFRDGKFSILDRIEETEGDEQRFLNIRLRPDLPLPQSLHRTASGPDGISLLLGRDTALVRFPIHHGELKHFFEDPENYYYLPEEDTVVHKSVGQFADPSHRVRATRKNCFIRKECDYLMIPVPSDDACLRTDRDDKNTCLEIPEAEGSLKDLLVRYFSAI